MADIREAIVCGAIVNARDSFHERNMDIAKAEVLIAFTWSNGEAPLKGGTLDTWKKCTGRKIHVPNLRT